MLPPSAAAHLTDDALIQSVAAAQRPGGWNVHLSMTALAKFASPKALPRVKAIYESQQDRCQPELMAYFVRVDPAYADRVFQSHPWDIRTPPPACTAEYFARTAPLAMSPGLERYLAAYLMQGDVRLKKTAAESLGEYGSPAALAPLWGAFRYFNDYWKGKEAELARNGEGEFLEVDLRNAIARGRHWLATDADLRTILSLCVSDCCLYETQQDLSAWREPLTIGVDALSARIRAQVVQYYHLESIDALEEKLAQFPKGTHFTLAVHGESADALAARIRTYGAAHGLTVVSR